MGVTIQVHPDSYDVRFFPATDRAAFAVIRASEGDATASLFMTSPAACDELIKAAVEAKTRMLAVRPPAVITDEPKCPEQNPESGAWCTGTPGHAQRHRDADGEEWGDPVNCRYCEIEPATEGDFCEACAPAVYLVTASEHPEQATP